MKEYPVFVGCNSDTLPKKYLDKRTENNAVVDCRIPSLITCNDTVVAACDSANSGADWGFIKIVVRQSEDSGETFGNITDVYTPPVRKAPVGFEDCSSAFAMDPVMLKTADNKLIMAFDFFPESKGLHKSVWLENTDGYVTVGNKRYMALYSGKAGCDSIFARAKHGNIYTVSEDGWIFDSNNRKTRYYLPQHHSSDISYQTIGDMYYAVGEPDYIDKCPPLLPGEPKNGEDIYVGNVYLNKGKSKFTENEPTYVKKHIYYEKYNCVETKPAPLRAAVTSYIWITTSTDNGKTWSQPHDINAEIKISMDGGFFGTAPGTGICLSNGRLLFPMYALNDAAVIYSDDNGTTWHRNNEKYCFNIDENQLIEAEKGTVICVGRPKSAGNMPHSISSDYGTSWKKHNESELYSVKCQHSLITIPKNIYCDKMDKNKCYVLCTRPTGHGGTDSSRSDGKIALGEILSEGGIKWIKELLIKPDADNDFFAYSSIAILPDGKIGVLYEPFPSSFIALCKIDIAEFFL